MKSILRFLSVLAVSSPMLVFAHSAVDPVPRGDRFWQDRHNSINERVAEAGEKAQLIFIGDSITQGWEGAGREVWEENFSRYNAVNLGISGDRTQHVLWRLDNGNLKGLQPKAAVVMIGTNNSNGEDNTSEQIAEGVRKIVEKLRATLPRTKVLLVSIFPRGENPNPQRGKILQANQILQKLTDGENVIWVDFGHKYLNDEGLIPGNLMPDYLHLSKRGYEIWAESLREPLQKVLGGKDDSAAARLNGDWILTMPGPNDQEIEMPFSLSLSGSTITGTFRPEGRELKIENGRMLGNEVTWTVKRDRPEGGIMTYNMSGALQDGRIIGRTTTQLEGEEITNEWKARRK